MADHDPDLIEVTSRELMSMLAAVLGISIALRHLATDLAIWKLLTLASGSLVLLTAGFTAYLAFTRHLPFTVVAQWSFRQVRHRPDESH